MQQIDIFGNKYNDIPETEGFKYAGSKLKILPYIFNIISGLEIKTVLDGFSGSTRVSQAFAKLGYDVISNDVAFWSEIFATAYLLNKEEPKKYQGLIDHLNGLDGYEGWFSLHYGGIGNNGVKFPFQLKNTMKLDAIRDEIESIKLTKIEKAVALTSLILAMDSVDSTLGHYVSYLSDWSPRSYNDMKLRLPKLFINKGNNTVVRDDVFNTVKKYTVDFAYFDPPYGSNNEKMPPSRVRYDSYYHIWKSIILNDRPKVFGKANRREDSRDQHSASVFEEFRKDNNGKFIAIQAIRKLIRETNARYILLSYSSGGRATQEELFEILNESCKLIRAKEIDYRKNVMSNMCWTNEWINNDNTNYEYLFLVEK